MDELLEKERIPPIMAFFKTEPHSDFLCVFASRGLLGVIAFGALLIFPLAYFLASLTRGDARRVASAHSGLTLIIVLAIAGFSITMIDQRAMICFLAVMVAITLYLSWASGSTRCIGIDSR